jgi:GTPase KRas protein
VCCENRACNGTLLLRQWIREGQAFMILYSVDDPGSFDNAQAMRKKIERAKDVDSFPMVLVGNKCDLTNRLILTERGAAKALEMGCPFVETSAKAGVSVFCRSFFISGKCADACGKTCC